jgi:FMN phosphatase YigB (HAD superfamily)
MRFRAVLLDLGDTIFALGPIDTDAVVRGFAKALEEEGALSAATAQAEAARVLEALRADWRRAYATAEMAEPSIAASAAPYLLGFGSAAESLAWRIERLFGDADVARFLPGVDCAARVQRLRDAGLKVGIVSNTTTQPAVLTAYLETLGVASLAGAIAYSVEVGVRKPHESIYRRVLERLDVDATEAVFVGDRVREDVLGPRRLGMEAVLTHEFRQESPGESAPLAVLNSLWDLPELLA